MDFEGQKSKIQIPNNFTSNWPDQKKGSSNYIFK